MEKPFTQKEKEILKDLIITRINIRDHELKNLNYSDKFKKENDINYIRDLENIQKKIENL